MNEFYCYECRDWSDGDEDEHICYNSNNDSKPLDEIFPRGQNKRDNIKQSKYEFKSYNYQKNKHHIHYPAKDFVSNTDLKLNPHLKKRKYNKR
jgi:hypothetical protein